ncbi:hypothetical protein [Amycolatopsis tolypomycina]|uniref:hypothetical protein n=1 Tax=Amycolatopsis tolypomycina TaxID=208445 RepID=UPI001FC988DB|nr:hypothetical protein [Amycolatopsis tolypomycina]
MGGNGILLLSTPGVCFGDVAEARRWVRDVNEFAAEVVLDRPGRFGPSPHPTLPDVDGALAEAEYALDALHADGIVLPANNDGSYPGDSGFDRSAWGVSHHDDGKVVWGVLGCAKSGIACPAASSGSTGGPP